MRPSPVANLLLSCLLLVSCASVSHQSGTNWDDISYAHTAAAKRKVTAARDYDADYSLPAGGSCMDDTPGCY